MITDALINEGIANFKGKTSKNPYKERSVGIDEKIEERIKKSLIPIALKINRSLPKGAGLNSNILIYSDKIDYANEVGQGMGEIIKSWNDVKENQIISITEKKFLKMKTPETDVSVVIVQSFKGEKIDKIYERLDAFEHEGGNCSVIFCTTIEVVKKLKAFDRDDYRLYNYLLKNKCGIELKDEENVYNIVTNSLETDGMLLDDTFKAELQNYILAVYPEAVYEDRDFADDLIHRIYGKHYETLDAGNTLTENDIPFSIKAKKRIETISKESINEENHDNNEYTEDLESEEKKPESVREEQDTITYQQYYNPESYKYEDDEKFDGNTNILLLALSTFPHNGLSETTFTLQEKQQENSKIIDVVGKYQLDPVPLLMKEEGVQLDKIILLCTEATLKEKEVKIIDKLYKAAPIDVFYEHVKGSFTPLGDELTEEEKFCRRFNIIKLDEEKLANCISDAVNSIRKSKNPKLYIDPHGGFRSAQFSLLAIISLLKVTESPDIIQTVYEVEAYGETGNIYKRSDSIEINDFVSGINEFINYGRIDTLERYIKVDNELLKAIGKLSDGIAMCNIKTFDDGIKQITKYFSKKDENYEEKKSVNQYLRLFEGTIRQDFEGMIKNKDSYLEKVKWCLKKGFTQQAITIINEKMYEDMIRDGIVKFAAGVENKAKERLLRLESKADKKENTKNAPNKKIENMWKKETFKTYNFNYNNHKNGIYLFDKTEGNNWQNQIFNKKIVEDGYKCLNSGNPYRNSNLQIKYTNENIEKVEKKLEINPEEVVPKENMNINEFNQLMRLQRIIQLIRNQSNHAAEENPFDCNSIQKAVDEYIKLYELVRDKVKENKSNTQTLRVSRSPLIGDMALEQEQPKTAEKEESKKKSKEEPAKPAGQKEMEELAAKFNSRSLNKH